MRAPAHVVTVFALLSALVLATPVFGQNPVVTSRLAAVAKGAADTPRGLGLLQTALSEASIAWQEAVLAEKASGDLALMKQHAGGVLHAIDPSLVAGGPGLGYGIERAVGAIVGHLEAASASDSQADMVRIAPLALMACRNVLQWTANVISVAQRIRAATSVESAASLTGDLNRLVRQVVIGTATGHDARSFTGADRGGLHSLQFSMGLLLSVREGEVPTWMREVRR